jgi:aminoglycoside phosphotransferase (APT) family kinase protein
MRLLWLRQTMEQAGLDPAAPLTRVPTVTNEVWATPEAVIRINRDTTARLRREAWLAHCLPPEVGYPEVIAVGGNDRVDWMIQRRVPATALAHAWPDLSTARRREAVRQLAGRLRALHATPFPAGLPPTRAPHLLADDPADPLAPLRQGLAEVAHRKLLDPGLIRDLVAIVDRHADAAFPFPTRTFVHGDLTFENVLWDGEQVVGLVDLEFAHGGPPDLDLDVLLRLCAHPQLHVADGVAERTRAEDYASVPAWLAEDHPAMFAHPAVAVRCRLFSIAYDITDVLEFPPPSVSTSLPPYHASNRLRRTAAGTDQVERFFGGFSLV